MERIQFDSGMRAYRVNGAGILRFNPTDPNLYTRFLEAVEKLKSVEAELSVQTEAHSGEEIVRRMTQADEKMKGILNWVFGADNDFNKILAGVNLLAVAENGQRVVTNLFEALEPVLTEGAKRCAGEQASAAKMAAEARRSVQ